MNKREKNIFIHKSLAVAGGLMTLSGVFALAAGDVTWGVVAGTMLTGAFNCARNLGQWWYLTPRSDREADLSTLEGRQIRRKKDANSNFVSGATNMPQLIEGAVSFDPVRLATAGSAVAAYALRGFRYRRAYERLRVGKKDQPGYLTERFPADLMVVRGIGQTILGATFFTAFGPLSGIALVMAGLVQAGAAVVMRKADKKGVYAAPEQDTQPEPPSKPDVSGLEQKFT